MNLNSLAIPGIKLTELPAFLKKNGIEGEEAQKLTEYLTAADKAGSSNKEKGDGFITSQEISFYQPTNTEKLASATIEKLRNGMLEWEGEGAVDLKELSQAKNLKLKEYTTGNGDSLHYASGNITISAKDYKFSIGNPKNNLEQARLALTDVDGNRSYLTGSDIPKEFVNALINNKDSAEKQTRVRKSSSAD